MNWIYFEVLELEAGMPQKQTMLESWAGKAGASSGKKLE